MVVRWNEKAHTVTNLKCHAICNFTYLDMALKGSWFFWKAKLHMAHWLDGLAWAFWVSKLDPKLWPTQVMTRAQLGLAHGSKTSLAYHWVWPCEWLVSQGFPMLTILTNQQTIYLLTGGSSLVPTSCLYSLSPLTILFYCMCPCGLTGIWKPLGSPLDFHHTTECLQSVSQQNIFQVSAGFCWFLGFWKLGNSETKKPVLATVLCLTLCL